jgi:hypothetical protein
MVSDRERGADEWREITRLADEAFSRPGDLEPIIDRHLRRARLELEEKPSFANYRFWAVWGPVDGIEAALPIRRITWRRDVDGDRGDPMARLRRLGSRLTPTIEVADSTIRAEDLKSWVQTLSVSSPAAELLGAPRSINLDGTRCSLSLDAGNLSWRHEWLAVGTDWQPTDPMYEALASWAMEFRDRLEAVIDGGGPIDKDRAIQIVRRAAAERGYSWIEPTHASERDDAFHVSSNAEKLGGNVLVVISRLTGQVREFHHYNR